MNVELLKRTLKRIEKDHKHFNMAWFFHKITARIKKTWDKNNGGFNALSCGTVGCFAGHVIIEALGPTVLKNVSGLESTAHVAQGLLEISDVDREELFYPSKSVYVGIHQHRPGTKAYAKFVVGCIRKYFKEKHGMAV